MKIRKLIIVILNLCLNVSVIKAQNGNQKIEASNNGIINPGFRNYEEIISKNAEIQKGLLTYYKVGDKHYFEIPESIFEKEILMVTKVSGFVQGERISHGAGSQPRPQQIIKFQKKNSFILMRLVTYDAVADKTMPIYKSVKNNNFEAIVYSFKIEATGKGKGSYIIGLNDFFTTYIPIIGGWQDYEKKHYGISGVDQSRSYIDWIKAFPGNIEVRHVHTYTGSNLPDDSSGISLELNQSFILLPENPMNSRLYDDRVGYFSTTQIDYSVNQQKAETRKYILRRHLVPTDWSAFSKGELVEPVKPIVYYIDPATPLKWRKYIKQGVEDWKKAFEKIGFKKAITAIEAPGHKENPDWSPEDIRYSVIRFEAKTNRGATGQNIHDPRTGEILQGNILFNYNLMDLLSKYFFVRTGAVNPDARPPKLKDEVMGRLIQTVITHEVGHTLGLMHNSLSLASYPVDSLRSPTFTSMHGTGESIMSYMFNYIAQPGDGVTHFFNELGAYDYWAIEYGYKPIIGTESPEGERNVLNQWVKEKVGDPPYRYGNTPTLLGNDQLRAAVLSVRNLKHIMAGLIGWSIEEGKDNELLTERYNEVNLEFEQNMYTIGRYIGRVDLDNNSTSDKNLPVYKYASFEIQKKAIEFLNKQLFETPNWLLNREVFAFIGSKIRLKVTQNGVLRSLIYSSREMIKNRILYTEEDYSPINLFSDLRAGIFREVSEGQPIDPFRRDLQKTMVHELEKLMKSEDLIIKNTDLSSIAMANLVALKEEIKEGIPRQTDDISKYHLQDLKARIDSFLHGNQD